MDRRSFLGVAGLGTTGFGSWFLATDQSPTYRAEVEAVTFEYVLWMRSLGPDVGEIVAPLRSLDDGARDPIQATIEGGDHAVDDPPSTLRQFFHRPEATPRYVSDDETYYELDAEFPVFTVRLEEVPPKDVDGDPATVGEFMDLMTDDRGRREVPVQELVESGEYRTYSVDPRMEAFVEKDGYLETGGVVGRVTIEADDPGAPYRITAREASAEEVHGGIVVELADVPSVVRDLVAEGIDRHRMGLDTVSQALADLVTSYDYVRADGWFYEPVIDETGSHHLPVEFETTLVEDAIQPFDPARIELSITNTAEETIGVSSGAPGPFGVLRGESDDDRLTLWSDAYAESDHVHTSGRSVRSVNDIGIVTELGPGETRTREYQIHRGRLAPGVYTIDGSIGIERYVTDENGGRTPESTTFPYELRIEIR